VLGLKAGDAARLRPPEGLVVTLADLVALAREHGRGDDPLIRQQIARLHCYLQVGQWTALRAKAESAAGDQAAGAAGASTGKIAQTRITKLAAEIALDIVGTGGLLAGADAAEGGRFAKAFLFARASSIYGGADEIQRNIAAERVLGLPREPSPDRHRPYREILHGLGRRADPGSANRGS
jgi:alkylation response protein AidB-like acyl-CoA dehydrogenase